MSILLAQLATLATPSATNPHLSGLENLLRTLGHNTHAVVKRMGSTFIMLQDGRVCRTLILTPTKDHIVVQSRGVYQSERYTRTVETMYNLHACIAPFLSCGIHELRAHLVVARPTTEEQARHLADFGSKEYFSDNVFEYLAECAWVVACEFYRQNAHLDLHEDMVKCETCKRISHDDEIGMTDCCASLQCGDCRTSEHEDPEGISVCVKGCDAQV